MQRSSFVALAGTLAMASSLCVTGPAHAQTTYTLTQVTANGGSTSTSVTGLDDEGDLTLTVSSGPTVNTYLWRRGIRTNIGGPTAAPQFVESGGMNDLVQIVGTTLSPTSGTFAGFAWQHGQMTELPSPAGSQAVFGMTTQLATLPGMPPNGTAQASNDRGQIVGSLSNIAVLWQSGVPFNLNGQVAKSDPLQPFVQLQSGTLINNFGQIVANGVDSRNPAFASNASAPGASHPGPRPVQ